MPPTVPFPGHSRPDLWETTVQAALPGVPGRTGLGKAVIRSFADRLEQAENLTVESARRLEHEYRRFLYLNAAHGGGLVPSSQVDKAWRLHVQTPDLDWTVFRRNHPGSLVARRAGLLTVEWEAAYRETLTLYRREFGEDPPRDIWPAERDLERGAAGVRVMMVGIVAMVAGLFLTLAAPVLPWAAGDSGAALRAFAALAIMAGLVLLGVGLVMSMVPGLKTKPGGEG